MVGNGLKLKKLPSAPSHLSSAAKKWWRAIVQDFDIDDGAGRLLLQSALEAFDRMKGAQVLLKSEGTVFRDRWGQTKPHPAVVIERDARSAMVTALRALNVDAAPGE